MHRRHLEPLERSAERFCDVRRQQNTPRRWEEFRCHDDAVAPAILSQQATDDALAFAVAVTFRRIEECNAGSHRRLVGIANGLEIVAAVVAVHTPRRSVAPCPSPEADGRESHLATGQDKACFGVCHGTPALPDRRAGTKTPGDSPNGAPSRRCDGGCSPLPTVANECIPNIAETEQTSVIVLSDQELAQRKATIRPIDPSTFELATRRLPSTTELEQYDRCRLTESSVSLNAHHTGDPAVDLWQRRRRVPRFLHAASRQVLDQVPRNAAAGCYRVPDRPDSRALPGVDARPAAGSEPAVQAPPGLARAAVPHSAE